jgi:GNAT superfamily N-acetyltransferase
LKIRPATEKDEAALRGLWHEFDAEVPSPPGFEPDTWERDWDRMRRNIGSGGVFLAEDDDGALGVLEASAVESVRWHVDIVHVSERARRRGVAKALLAACARAAGERGATYISLGVLVSNQLAESVWRRLGFQPVELVLGQPLDVLEARLGDAPVGPSRASTHVQTDDREAVERALAHFVPRLTQVEVHDATAGWIGVVDPVLDSDRDAQSRLAEDLSDRLGAVVVALALERGTVVRFRLYERGRMVDEYLSLPAFYGELDRGDELALEANPTLVARLTGADRDEVRRVARTAASPADLPPPDELYREIARMMGLGVDR